MEIYKHHENIIGSGYFKLFAPLLIHYDYEFSQVWGDSKTMNLFTAFCDIK